MRDQRANSTELLSPAGGIGEAFAAFRYGADAIYTGLTAFSARRRAKNMTLEELAYICAYAHLRKKKVYLALNTILMDEEIEDAVEIARRADACGVDGIILQDPGLFLRLLDLPLSAELHASTQMTADSAEAICQLYALGYDRIVAAREMELEEILHAKQSCGASIEVFLHGALCVCVSGQCFLSASIGQRSANRGDCAQPCRKRYCLYADGKPTSTTGFLLSMKDLCTGGRIQDLSVFDSLKIEGRMKPKEYVAHITHYYRNLLDGKKISRRDETMVSDAFSRGFTPGFALGADPAAVLTEGSAKHRGPVVGHVEQSERGPVLAVREDIQSGDGITFPSSDGHWATGTTVNRDLRPGDRYPIYGAQMGAAVYRNRSTRLEDVYQGCDVPQKLPLDWKATLLVGRPFVLEARCGEFSVRVESQYVAQGAQKDGDVKRDLEDVLRRLGDTYFEVDKIEMDVDEDAFLPKSVGNALRRDVIEALQIKAARGTRVPRVRILSQEVPKRFRAPHPARRLLYTDVPVPEKALRTIDEVVLTSLSHEAASFYQTLGMALSIRTPSVNDRSFFSNVDDFAARYGITSFEVHNYGYVDVGKHKVAGTGFSIANRYAVERFARLGFVGCMPSIELDMSHIKRLREAASLPIRVMVYDRARAMAIKAADNDVFRRLQAGEKLSYADETGAQFPIARDGDHLVLYNAVPTWIGGQMPGGLADEIGILYDEHFEEVLSLLASPEQKPSFSFTTGRFRKGVL